ncbi:MAG: flagellar protein FlgN [Porticoccaceae bacterium]|nr:flagellar protein FlgN [Porticoccaceae bacterium]
MDSSHTNNLLTDDPAALISTIAIEYDLSTQLLRAIQQERQAILASDLDAVGRLGANKRELAVQLESTGHNRDRLLRESGFEIGAHGMSSLLETHPLPALADAWRGLSELVSQCKEENRLVGMVISKQLLIANQAIQVIKTGASTSERLYAASGEVAQNTLSSTLAKI